MGNASGNYWVEIIGGREHVSPIHSEKNTIFHSNCRGILVAILKDEEELPKIAGIPQSLRDRFGDAVNDLLPRKPITRKGTPARVEADAHN
jgi:hypothetical protein